MPSSSTRRSFLAAAGTAAASGLAHRLGSDDARPAGSQQSPGGRLESGRAADITAWPAAGYDAANTGYTRASGPADSISETWHHETGRPVDAPPVVEGGRVYLPVHDGLVARSVGTGERVWRTDVESPGLESAPVVAGGRVFVGFDDSLFAFDAVTGEQQWRRRLPENELRAPAVAGEAVYVACGGNGAVFALAAETGDVRWQADVDRWIPDGVAVRDGVVYAVGGDEAVVALDAADGSVRWRRTFEAGFRGAPTAGDERVYVGSEDGTLYALDAAGGRELWRFDSNPTVSHEPGERPEPGPFGSAALAHGRLYVGSSDTHLYALDAATGEVDWSFWSWNDVATAPAVTDDAVYVGSADTMLYALDVATGERRWEFSTRGRVGSPAVVDGRVFVGTSEDRVYALREAER
jgi:outer membrane protein assembly factor BamB